MVDEVRQAATAEAPAQEESRSPLADFFFHQRKAAEQTLQALGALIPPEFKSHSSEARKEFVTSFKVLFEGANEALSRELDKVRKPAPATPEAPIAPIPTPTPERPKTTGKNKVKVEVV